MADLSELKETVKQAEPVTSEFDGDFEVALDTAHDILHKAMIVLGFYADIEFTEELAERDRNMMLSVAEEIRDYLADFE
jgi:hypothetical protein